MQEQCHTSVAPQKTSARAESGLKTTHHDLDEEGLGRQGGPAVVEPPLDMQAHVLVSRRGCSNCDAANVTVLSASTRWWRAVCHAECLRPMLIRAGSDEVHGMIEQVRGSINDDGMHSWFANG